MVPQTASQLAHVDNCSCSCKIYFRILLTFQFNHHFEIPNLTVNYIRSFINTNNSN